jgi:hypothetical protein
LIAAVAILYRLHGQAAMMFASTWKVLSGKGVTWKGRTYDPKVVR